MGEQRERTRVKSRIDELPEEVVNLINERLSDVSITYQEISEEVTELGYEISKSSVGRYAIRQNKATQRLKEAQEQTKALLNAVKKNPDLDYTEAGMQILMDSLVKRIAMAQEEFDSMPLDKAGRLITAISRTKVYKDKFKLQYKKGVSDAAAQIKNELKRELEKHPDILMRINELVDNVTSNMEAKDE